ncbi:MerR family transcriptional regulator [Actinoplanes hulinensis]|uniref:MerR family transcriptional regulator n=1 Tax=Actinoplanes hulinensis TaxID=1144547 RepID=A0ABS7AXU2_9ACTN|nr:MerR family transcriptional regulator [Actinoplanes hulinensis]MBW6433384.1 MerR family transcriptional regulator [Actinoplanes hulinensis]
MRIGDLAARAGVSVRSLRYYEEQGLLVSTRSPGGQRQYTDKEVGRVRFIQRLYAAGLASRTIAELLPCVDSPTAQNADAAWTQLHQERDRITQHIEELAQARDALDELIAINREHRSRLAARSAEAFGPRQ